MANFLSFSICFLIACTLGGNAVASDKIPLIFVPGLKGSKLIDPHGHVAWVSSLNVLGYNPDSLRLPLFWRPEANSNQIIFNQLDFSKFNKNAVKPRPVDSGEGQGSLNFVQVKDELTPAGALAYISVIPWLFEEKVYGPFLKEAAKWERPFYVFSYDWRRDNNENAELLKRFVLKIKKDRQIEDVDVVSHSMGGLLVYSLMNQYSHLFRKVVFAGVPFHGGVGFMPDIHVGTATGLNKKILSPEVLFSFPSVYTLFPDEPDQSDALDENKKTIKINYFSLNDWKNFKLGLFSLRPVTAAEEAFLGHALAQAKKFRQGLRVKNKEYHRSMVVLGHKFRTLSYMIKNGPKSVRGWDFESHPKVPGDGRVGANNLPPEYLPYDLYYSDAEHGQLLNDAKITRQIKSYFDAPN